MSEPQRVLQFWFGPLSEDGFATDRYSKKWWAKDPQLDDTILREFGSLHALLSAGARPPWMDDPKGLMAAVVILDQFSRNMFRDTPAMYAADERALNFCYEGLALGFDRRLAAAHRVFLYMPLMHSERLACQERAVELFASLLPQGEGPRKQMLEENHRFAIAHRDIVARFGRFPHRNDILGRKSTSEELEFLEQPNSSF